MGNAPSATRWRAHCPAFPTNYAIFITCVRLPNRSADADRHAKKELKKQVRGVRPLERALEGRTDAEAEAVRGYGLAVRSALTDDGRPPLDADGLKLKERLQAIDDSISRVAEKRGSPTNSAVSNDLCKPD